MRALGSEVGLRVNDNALTASESAFELWVVGGKWEAEVAAFENKGDIGESLDDFGLAGSVVAEIVRFGDGVGNGKS